MRFIEFIFKLLWQFINFEPGRFDELKEKAYRWQNDQDALAETNPKWYHKILKYDKEWWFQVGLAVFFLFAFKTVRAWLAADPLAGDNDDDDDDDGDDDMVSEKRRKVSMPAFKF